MPRPARSSKPTVIDDRYPARKPGHEPGSFTLSFSAIACTRNIFTVSCMKNVKSDFDSFIKSPLHRWKVLHPVLLGKCPANRYLLSHSSTLGIRRDWKPSKISVGSFNRETFCHLDSKYAVMHRSYFYHLSMKILATLRIEKTSSGIEETRNTKVTCGKSEINYKLLG